MKSKLYTSEKWLRKKFYDENKSIQEIAKEAGVAYNTIATQIKKYGIK